MPKAHFTRAAEETSSASCCGEESLLEAVHPFTVTFSRRAITGEKENQPTHENSRGLFQGLIKGWGGNEHTTTYNS